MSQDYNNIEFINQLLNRKTKAKAKDIDAWLSKEENKKLLKDISEAREVLLKEKQVLKINIDQEVNTFKNSIGKSRRIRLYSSISIAASLLLVLGSYFIFVKDWNQETIQPTISQIIKPGKSKALLFLDDGRKIDLGKKNINISDGEISGITNDSLQGLQYNNLNTKPSDKIIYNTVKVPIGGEYQMTLSDGTKVWLNSNSEIKFPIKFLGKQRKVYLKGEAYFKVAHNKKKPFITKLEKGNIKVLGTEYNINAYKEENQITTTLVKGSIRFTSSNKEHNEILKPNQQIIYNLEKNTSIIKDVDPYAYIAWKEGKFYFKSMELDKILRQLKRWYGFNIFYTNEELKNYKFRGVILKEMPLDQALNLIEETTDIRFIIKGETVTVYKEY